MAAPNIVAVATITGKTIGAALTTSSADIVTNSAASGKVLKINAIYVANVDGTSAVGVTVNFYDASVSSGTAFALVKTVTVPADATLDILSRSIYLEEGDKIAALASVNGDAEIVVSYEEIS